jgi:hypothetical protein
MYPLVRRGLAGDELCYTATAGGIGGTATLVWKRAK